MQEQLDTDEISCLLQQFWEIGNPRTSHDQPILNPDEQRALEQVEKSLKYMDGRYQVALPLKENVPGLPYNCDMALCRLYNTERRLLKNPEIAAAYSENITLFGEGLHSQDRPNRGKTRKEMVPATLSCCKT